MAVSGRGGGLQRLLPALLLFLLLALVAAPQRSSASPGAVASCAAVEAAPESSDVVTKSDADAERVRPADRITVLRGQFAPGVRGSRAPPALSV